MPYEGNVGLINGLIPVNGQNFPLVHMDHVYVDDNWRLSDVLRDIAYREIEGTITLAPEVADTGRTLTSISVIWHLNQVPERIVVNGTFEVPEPTMIGAESVPVNITEDSTITVEVYDAGNPLKPAKTIYLSADVIFRNRVYWGAAADPSIIDSEFIMGLSSSDFRESLLGTITATAGENQYIWFAYPAEYGTAVFDVEGWKGGFLHQKAFTFVNQYNHSEVYRVYRSARPNIGTVTAMVS